MNSAGLLFALSLLLTLSPANAWQRQRRAPRPRSHPVRVYRYPSYQYQPLNFTAPLLQSPMRPLAGPPPADRPVSHPAPAVAVQSTPPQWYDLPVPQPPQPQGSGPSQPPVMLEFSDQFAAAAIAYVKAQAKSHGGVFSLRAGPDKEALPLRLLRVRTDKITSLSTEEAYGCVEFETADSLRQRIDADFYVEGSGNQWSVSRVLVHRFAGRPALISDHETLVVAHEAIPKPAAPANLSLDIVFEEPTGSNALVAGGAATLQVTIANEGKGTAYAVALAAKLQKKILGLTVAQRVAVGEIKPGRKVTRAIALSAAEDAPSAQAKIVVDATEGNGFDAEPVIVEFETEAFAAPKLELANLSIGGSGVVRAGEPTDVTVEIRNSGAGAAKDAAASLNLGPDIFMSGDAKVSIGELAPGATAKANFEFFVNKRHKSGEALPITLTLFEATGRFGASALPLGLSLDRVPDARVLVVKQKPVEAAARLAAPETEDVDAPPAAKTPSDPDAYAVAIGIEKYRDVPGVDFAARDAQIFQAYLTRSMGFDEKNVALLQDERATLTDLATYLGPWLADRVGKKSRVFVYFAGHGAPDPKTGETYLVPYDGNPSYPETKAFAMKDFYAALAKLPAKEIVVVLDACFSGAGGRSVMAAGARPLVSVRAANAPKNVVVLSASGGEQISVSYPEGKHGLMTYYLLKGLRGAADVEGDGQVTTEKLFRYLSPEVERQARERHVEQTPRLAPPSDELGKRGRSIWVKLK